MSSIFHSGTVTNGNLVDPVLPPLIQSPTLYPMRMLQNSVREKHF
jgi:hypothetical protein